MTQENKNENNKNDRPGRLTGSVPFEIHTADAGLLFSGHTGKEGIGLLQFGGQMAKIWGAAENDDPYADWYLLKIYDAMTEQRGQLEKAVQMHQEKIQKIYSRSNLIPTPFKSQKPLMKPLWFRTQYGYLGANLIAEFDGLMRAVLTAERIGILLGQPHAEIKETWMGKIGALFKLPFKWRQSNTTRQDFENKNEAAQEAQKTMGEIPAEILNKTLRSPFAPNIKFQKPAPQAA